MNSPDLLIVDDEESIHLVLVPYLRELGIHALSAYNGIDGVQFVRQQPALRTVLTDIRLPGMDGLDVLREVKALRSDVRVIVMTAFSDKSTAIQALKLGADDFLEKPFRLEELQALLEQERKHDSLVAESQKWREGLDQSPTVLLWCDKHGIIQRLTPDQGGFVEQGQSLIGKRASEILNGKEWSQLLAETATGRPHIIDVSDLKRLHVQVFQWNEQSDPPGYLLIISDVTARRILEREIEDLAQAFESRVEQRTVSLSNELDFSEQLLDAVGVLVAYIDHSGRLARFNKFGEQITGLNKAAAEQLFSGIVRDQTSPLADVFNPSSERDISSKLAELPIAGRPTHMMAWTVRRMNESARAGGKLIVGVDVTEQKSLEKQLSDYNAMLQNMVETRAKELRLKDAQLIHSARLATLGEIAAGIAHEMKQPLNVISITADLIKLLHRNGTLNDDLLVANLEKIRATVDRMASTINHLRGFTRIDAANFRRLKVEEIFDGALAIVGEQIRLDDIDVLREIEPELPAIAGELHQLEQVMVNLLQNARDAIEERGNSGVKKTAALPRLITLTARSSADKSEVYLEVKDTGTGLSDEARERLFEPFFTTKDAERGTGLGLSISMNIVQSHGGVLEAESAPGLGSTFRMVLPAANLDA